VWSRLAPDTQEKTFLASVALSKLFTTIVFDSLICVVRVVVAVYCVSMYFRVITTTKSTTSLRADRVPFCFIRLYMYVTPSRRFSIDIVLPAPVYFTFIFTNYSCINKLLIIRLLSNPQKLVSRWAFKQ